MNMGPMFIEPPPAVHLLMAAAVLGFLVGVAWIRRITDIDSDAAPSRSIFRSRDDEPKPDPIRRDRPRVAAAMPAPIRRRMTARWLLTRLELAVAVVCVALAATPFWLPAFVGHIPRPMFASPWFDLLPMLGLAGSVIGLVWMFRIAWHDPEARPSIWRSDRD